MTPKAAGAAGEASPMESPTVTIVIPLYDGGRFIAETLRSALAQSFRRFEVIVVDDGSTDDGPAIVRDAPSDPRVRLVSSPAPRGRGWPGTRARRRHRTSGHLLFLDADDLLHPDAVATLVADSIAAPTRSARSCSPITSTPTATSSTPATSPGTCAAARISRRGACPS